MKKVSSDQIDFKSPIPVATFAKFIGQVIHLGTTSL